MTTHLQQNLILLALSGLILSACGGSGNPPTPDASGDARLPDGATVQCRGDVECDDGLFCNGAETCDPANAAADTTGCVLGELVNCGDGVDCTADSCDEERRACRHEAPDNDGDGHAAVTCVDDAGAALGDDCDDNDANRFPGNVEVCNSGDEDCNPETLGFLDGDGDGASSSACSNPQADGSTLRGPDCNDDDTAIRPGAPDGPMLGCDNIDNDCNGTIDVGCPCTSGTVVDCGAPEELAMTGECRPGSQTCIDGSLTEVCSGATHATEEFCDGRDNDCDGEIDEGVMNTYYPDTDGDGFGDPAGAPAMACSPPAGFVRDSSDCDDTSSATHPGAAEICDAAGGGSSADENCDGTVNEGCACTAGETQNCGPASDAGECVFGTQRCVTGVWGGCEGAVLSEAESCNGRDDDCDGSVDNGVLNTYYRDQDGDGFGDAATTRTGCSPPTGYVTNSTDCAPSAAQAHPGGVEVCDGTVDEDCDGSVDEGCGCTDGTTRDCGPSSATGVCVIGRQRCTGGVWATCEGAVRPTPESCNGADDDCDGSVDEGVKTTFYPDTDGDGFGASTGGTAACAQPAGFVANNTDCEPTASQAHPGGTEVCDGTLDEDCDGSVDEGCGCTDGMTQSCGPSTATGACVIGTQRCTGGVWATCEGAVRPTPESCNGADDDCDGSVDEGVKTTFYPDTDGDGFGASTGGIGACAQPAGFVANNTDCRDGNAGVHPGATELCNGVDDNCVGGMDEGCDCTDGMTQACGMSSVGACVDGTQICVGGGWSSCAGFVASVPEACNGIDDDCNGVVDNGFTCRQGQTRSCTTSRGVTGGTQSCLADCGGWTACSHAEVCNGFDDDLDGVADETFACVKGGFATCTNSCGELTSFGACTNSCAIPAPAACFLPTEVCNYCDDDGNPATTDEVLAIASTIETPASCSNFRMSGTACCGGSCTLLGGTAVQLINGENNRAGAAWLTTPRHLGWGPITIHATVRAATVGGARPADAWTVILADSAAGGSDLGALGSGHGVPLNRTGISIEWDFYDHNETPARPDRILVYRLNGGGAKTLLGSAADVDDLGMWLNAGSAPRHQQLYITYTPDDPASAGSEERLTVRTAPTRAPIIDIDTTNCAIAPCPTVALGNELSADSDIDIGFTAGAGGLTANLALYLNIFEFTARYTTDISRERVCF